MPTFSIATPTRNSLAKLKRCVGSVRGQYGVSVEHIVQDACSSDGTPEWLQTQTSLTFKSEPDAGMYDAINRAWSRSKGDYVSWLNSDEQYLPGTLTRVEKYFQSHPEVDVVFGDYVVCSEAGSPIALRREIPFRRIYVVNGFLYAYSCTLFYRRRLLEAGLLHLNTDLKYAADKDLILRLSAEGAVIRHLPFYMAIFGIDGTNLSTHPGMLEETESLRNKYGAFAAKGIRRLIMSGRTVERLIRGGFQERNLAFRYAVDETPTYLEVVGHRIGGRYSLGVAAKEVVQLCGRGKACQG